MTWARQPISRSRAVRKRPEGVQRQASLRVLAFLAGRPDLAIEAARKRLAGQSSPSTFVCLESGSTPCFLRPVRDQSEALDSFAEAPTDLPRGHGRKWHSGAGGRTLKPLWNTRSPFAGASRRPGLRVFRFLDSSSTAAKTVGFV